ncbi:copper-transporting ATPase PAA1, chloroplastic-like [Zingiber officinale]|uniref:copper-transporting ATPase PAA1, chloroplastic-like n=1 Tax=Zingiber officinale TaxID=94328 RepID=UPI001C4D9491|nr:copper-transporting ATPase PAA1, chloroplastic-like [Zingiber officinale]
MDSFAFCTMPLLAFSHSLKFPHRLYLRRLLAPPNPGLFTAGRARCFGSLHPNRPREIFLISLAGSLLRTSSLGSPVNRGLACISSSTGSSGPNGGGNDGTGRWDGDGGGDGGFRGSGAQSFSIGEESVEASSRVPDVIILDVGGMTCGGCAASVKRILESQPQVSSASVNLATETAIVWAIPETKVLPNWKQQLGVRLAGNLTTCGFKSSFRDSDRVNVYKVFERKMDEKLQKLKQSGRELAVSWALCAVCLLGHVSHIFKAGPSWLQTCHSTSFHMSLSLFTFFGPGRKLVLDGFRSLFMGSPNMNTLVGLGALSSFAVSSIAALIPKLGWKTFFEEPIMLIAFVLLGKNLEQRAKIKATSDMTGLLNILPAKARLMIHTDAREVPSTVEVPCSNLHIGDQVVVLPGDRVPADGIVKAGRSTVDESSFTGEPLPVTKLPGAEVTAGSINLNGTLTIEVRRPGGETAMGDIVRLVENAQTREAPVQRLADKVAGHFTYGVMALSAATFAFWSLFGSQLVPAALIQGSVVSLALQLSCSVLVVACPCALGLATPTAVLVGTSLGATRGLLLRGGDVLEKFAAVDTIVFDKTGTLTIGKPVVTRVMPSLFDEHEHSKENSGFKWTEADILRLAAGVESNTNHPIGKAIVEAAHSIGCENVKAKDGTFTEEPGSGAVAIIEKMKVSVGTLSWVRRHGVHGNQFPDAESQNQSVVYVGVDSALAGVIYFEDKVREDARLVVETLAKQGINIYMLSGDKKNAAEYVASMIGIDKRKVLYEVKPEEKKRFISELQKEKQIVAMVGDGINDAAALASADVGIAMGEGVGAASDVSSVVLLGNKLSQLIDALDLSKSTMKTVKQNLWWAFAYNIVGIPVAAGVLLPSTGTILTPSIAGGLMGLSSVGVMMNSLLLRFKVEQNKKKVDTDSKESRGTSDFLVQIQNQKQNPYPVK